MTMINSIQRHAHQVTNPYGMVMNFVVHLGFRAVHPVLIHDPGNSPGMCQT